MASTHTGKGHQSNGLVFTVTDNLDTASKEMVKKIDKAVLAAAFKIRDDARDAFAAAQSKYKYATPKYHNLESGIMVGHLYDSHVKIHAMGAKSDYDTYKTRFFVGGTVERMQMKRLGQNIKPFTKGSIQKNEAIDIAFRGAESTLNKYIQNVLDDKK